jgi:hypothetical protein
MKRWNLLVVIVVALLVVSGCTSTQQNPKTIREANVCGDGVCGATEDCNTCLKDCICGSGQYCDSMGICKTPVCGDGTCSATENQTQTCCDDCGCSSISVCNKVTETCQDKIPISDEIVRTTALFYMLANNISGNITQILDAYYNDQTVKQVSINCRIAELPYPCAVYLYIDATGQIVDSVRVA